MYLPTLLLTAFLLTQATPLQLQNLECTSRSWCKQFQPYVIKHWQDLTPSILPLEDPKIITLQTGLNLPQNIKDKLVHLPQHLASRINPSGTFSKRGDYFILGKLGSGAFGIVSLAYKPSTGFVAIKSTGLNNSHGITAFFDEIGWLNRLKLNQHTIRLHAFAIDATASSPTGYEVEELATLGSLVKLVGRKAPLPCQDRTFKKYALLETLKTFKGYEKFNVALDDAHAGNVLIQVNKWPLGPQENATLVTKVGDFGRVVPLEKNDQVTKNTMEGQGIFWSTSTLDLPRSDLIAELGLTNNSLYADWIRTLSKYFEGVDVHDTVTKCIAAAVGPTFKAG